MHASCNRQCLRQYVHALGRRQAAFLQLFKQLSLTHSAGYA